MTCSRYIIYSWFYSVLLSCSAIASVIVISPTPDFNPVDLSITGERKVAEGSALDLTVVADFDPSKLIIFIGIGGLDDPIGEIDWSFELLQGPTNMTISADGRLNWIGQLESETQLRSQKVEVRATATEQDTQNHWSDTIEAYVFALPLAPHLSDNPTPIYYEAGILGIESIYIVDADDDADGEQLEFSIIDGPSGCHITDRGWIYWIPPHDAEGQVFDLTIQVADGNEHGKGPSILGLKLHITEAPAGAKLQDTIYQNTPGFGSSISLDNQHLVIGADQHSQVFIYADTEPEGPTVNDSVDWQLVETLTGLPLTIEHGSEYILMDVTPKAFGASVAIDGEWLLVGAPLTDLKYIPHGDTSRAPIIAAGAAFFYRHDAANQTWRLHQVIYDHHNSSGAPYQFFGGSVAMQNGIAVVSNDSANNQAGEATIYTYNPDYDKWDRHRTIDNYDIPIQSDDYFSYPLVIDGTTIAIAANEDDSAGFNAGAVYLFEWPISYPVTQTKITSNAPQAFALFGQALALSGDWLAVASPNANQLSGNIELWRRQSDKTWQFEQTLTEPGTYYNGLQLSLEGGTLAVSSPGFEHNEIKYPGRIYLYRYDGNEWMRILEHRQETYVTDANFAHRMSLSPDGQSLLVASTGSSRVYDYSLREGDFPTEQQPADYYTSDPSLSDSDLLKLYQVDSLPLSAIPTAVLTLTIDDGTMTYSFPERTNAINFPIQFKYSRDLIKWQPLQSYRRLNSTRMESGWIRRIAIEIPDDSTPFFIRQEFER
ncbi:MAG: hypothetical protein ACI8Z5_002512 [Lentimonas sp.]|jgi:hypothetical protein